MNHTRSRPSRARPQSRVAASAGSLALAIGLLPGLAACHQDDASGSPPSPSGTKSTSSADPTSRTTASPATSPSSTKHQKTATPGAARAAEVKEAQAAYVRYINAYIKAGKDHRPSSRPPKNLLAMTTGPESKWLKNEFAAAQKKNSVIVSGNVNLTMGNEFGYDGSAVDVVRFHACQDSRTIRLRVSGHLKRQSFKWELDKVEMHSTTDNSGRRRWVTFGQTAEKRDPDKSCKIG